MRCVKDLTGQTKGRLTALRYSRRDKWGRAVWFFRCACDGKEIEVAGFNFTSGNTASCGCVQRERTAVSGFKHGHYVSGESPTHRSWSAMVCRTTNPHDKEWGSYGGANPPIT